jgi:hypothetical protein
MATHWTGVLVACKWASVLCDSLHRRIRPHKGVKNLIRFDFQDRLLPGHWPLRMTARFFAQRYAHSGDLGMPGVGLQRHIQ